MSQHRPRVPQDAKVKASSMPYHKFGQQKPKICLQRCQESTILKQFAIAVSSKRVVGCRGGSQYVEGCRGFPYLKSVLASWFRGSLVSCFLVFGFFGLLFVGFLVYCFCQFLDFLVYFFISWFRSSFVSKCLGFLVSKFQWSHITKIQFQFHVFW